MLVDSRTTSTRPGRGESVSRDVLNHAAWRAYTLLVTPIPLLLFFWGIAMVLGILPNRIFGWALPATPFWFRARRILGFAAVLSCGFWLTLDLALPAVLPSRQFGGRLADTLGAVSLFIAIGTSLWLIFSHPPTSTPRRQRISN